MNHIGIVDLWIYYPLTFIRRRRLSMEQITYQKIKKEQLPALAGQLTEQEYHMLSSEAMRGLAAYQNEEPVGLLLFTKATDGLLSLERIEVKESHRRKGIGTEMMTLFCRNLRKLKFELLISFSSADENTEFFQFLKSLRTFYIKEETGFEAVLSKEEISAICKTFATDKVAPKLFFQQNRNAKQQFLNDLEKEYPQIAWELKHMPAPFRQDLCCCETEKDGSIQSICLISENEEEFELNFLYAKGGKGTLAAKALIGTVNLMQYQEPKALRMSISNENAKNVLQHMSKNYEVMKKSYIAYYLGE